MIRDLRHAWRMLRARPGFTWVAVLTLALGIGANTAIFSLMEAALLRALPVAEPQQLFSVEKVGPKSRDTLFSQPLFERMRAAAAGTAHLAASSGTGRMYASAEGGQPEPVLVQLVSADCFAVLGVRPVLGRGLEPRDARAAGPIPAVVSHAYWQGRMGRDRGAPGRRLAVNGAAVEIVGVAPPGFFGLRATTAPEIWLALEAQPAVRYAMNARSTGGAQPRRPWTRQEEIHWLELVARVADPGAVSRAAATLDTVVRQDLEREAGLQADPERRRLLLATRVALEPGSRSLAKLKERLGQPLTVLLAMSGLVLLIACANVANLLTARGLERRREIAIRMAMGARRGRVLRQMLVESLLLAALGSAAGLVAAYWAVDLLLHWMSGPSGSLAVEPRLNVAVLGFTAAVSVGAALLFGILPALRATRVEPAAEAKAGWAAPGGSFPRLARGLVAAQIALSLVLLAGAGLFVRTLRNLAAADLGYDRHAVLSARIDPHAAGYPEQRLHELYRRLVERARAAPGVVSASVSHFSPGAGFMMSSGFYVIGRAPRPGEDHGALNNTVSPGYFGTLGIPLAAGRDFDARDRRGSPAVAIVNQAFARKFFGNERAIGRRIGYGPTQSDPFEIVGVVQDVKFGSARRRFDPVVYRSVWQSTETLTSVDVRVRGDARAAASLVRQALAEVDQDLPVLEVRTLAEMVSRGLATERMIARLTGFFGLLALALAGVGLYGVVSCGVVRRTRELGIRMALGADAGVVLRMVLREAALLTAAGLAVGLPLTLAATRLVRSMLFGLSPGDPLTLAAAGTLLAAVAFAAALWPARRAARVDPLAALRYE